MLIEEKRDGDVIWYRDNVCKYRIKYEDSNSIIWVNYDDFDIGMAMMLWDFKYDVEEARINMKIDKSWDNIGFKIDKEKTMQFIGVVEFFLTEKSPQDMILNRRFINEWYSTI
ncbi:hypothetical protein [Clostridium cagae]|uniref:hypothetical protein n=1 Tax=Clostridium cagae TaxID=2080751 RepID=UPI000CF6B810|nr:hypothetical protein [Clostridium cagae]